MSVERGYIPSEMAKRGCICAEEFEHDGKCQNGLRGDKYAKCPPCSQGWHFPYPCSEHRPKPAMTTQCDRCGWDLGAHQPTDRQRALIVAR